MELVAEDVNGNLYTWSKENYINTGAHFCPMSPFQQLIYKTLKAAEKDGSLEAAEQPTPPLTSD